MDTIDSDWGKRRVSGNVASQSAWSPTPRTGPRSPLMEPRPRRSVRRVVRDAGRPTRVRLLHALSASPAAAQCGSETWRPRSASSQSTCSHHVDRLPRSGSWSSTRSAPSMVSVNAACCTGLPHAADVVMGTLDVAGPAARGPAGRRHHARDDRRDLPVVRDIYAEGIATRNATFETVVPTAESLGSEVAPRAPLGRRGSTARSSAGPPSAPSLRRPATPASARPRST